MRPLAIIATRIGHEGHLKLTMGTVSSLKRTADCDVLVVDDNSPNQGMLDVLKKHGDVELVSNDEHKGFAPSVNIGLARAREEGRDALVTHADIYYPEEGWLERLSANKEAAVCGGLLLHQNNVIQNAGFYYSPMHRQFEFRFRWCPGNMREANRECYCPVTAAMMFIRHECLAEVGLFDDEYRFGFEDIDYCVRVLQSGRKCWYTHRARAYHYEAAYNDGTDEQKQWYADSRTHFAKKFGGQPLPESIPFDLHAGVAA